MQQDKGFKVGDVVRFLNCCSNGTKIPFDFVANAKEFVCHGNTTFKKNQGVIKGIIEGYYYIEYVDEEDEKVCLGFKSDSFELLEPKQEQYYTSIPTDVKVGDKFEVVSNIRLNDTIQDFSDQDVKIGDIITLTLNDGTVAPFFNNGRCCINWGCLKPVKVVTDSHLADIPPTVLFGRDSLSNTDIQQFEIGDEIEVTNNTRPTILTVSVGSKGVIIPTDNPCFFLVDFGNKTQYCKPQQLKLINKTNHNYGKVQNNSMSFSTTSYKITRGETICSSAIRCSKSKIQI